MSVSNSDYLREFFINEVKGSLRGEVNSDVITSAVNEYLAKNPVSAGATAEEAAQIQANKTALENLSNDLEKAISEEELDTAVESALDKAKESGEFKGDPGDPGAPGYTPKKGTDYWTDDDREQMVNDVLTELPAAEGVSY